MSDVAVSVLKRPAVSQRDNTASHAFKAAVFRRDEVARCGHWLRAFADERKDRRYYELVENTIQPEFDFHYFVIQDEAGEVRAVQPFFVLDQDIFAGSGDWIRSCAEFIRRFWPGFLTLRTLMVGCAAGEGHLDSAAELPRPLLAELLAAEIIIHARDLGVGLIVLKEFPATDREVLECFLAQGYTRVPSMPMTFVSLEYASFAEYMRKGLSRNMRSKLRRRLKASERAASLEMSVLQDITPVIEECYPLYLAVYDRATLKFEQLTKDYLCGLGRLMPDKTRFFVWRLGEKIVAFNLCMIEGDTICSEYIGLDYSIAFDLSLYYIVVRDVMSWAMSQGYKRYLCTALNYEPKFHLRHSLYPLDLYARHRSPLINFGMRYILPLVEPTRYDKILRRFSNYEELWPPKR